MGDKLNKDIAYCFTDGRHYNIQLIIVCHKPAKIINTATMSCDTIYKQHIIELITLTISTNYINSNKISIKQLVT